MKSDLPPDITPQTHPNHHTVGKDFMGHSYKHGCSARWFCKSHDASGYNMVNRADPEDETNISERAIGRTFHEIWAFEDGFETSAWGPVKIGQDGKARETAFHG